MNADAKPPLAGAAGSEMPDSDAEQTAWEWFALAHPHEAHAKSPDRFWKFFQVRRPGVPRDEMTRMLAESPNDQAEARRDGGAE